MTLQKYVEEYLSGNYFKKKEPRLVRWDKQVLAWTKQSEHNDSVIIVKYEDIVLNCRDVLKRVAEFAGISFTEEDLAVSRGSVREMQKDEEKHGAEAYLKATGRQERFIRKGKISGWKEELDRSLAESIQNEFANAMQRVGYDK